TYASRSISIGGACLRAACDQIIDKGRKIAAQLLETSLEDIEFEHGDFSVVGTDRRVGMEDVARKAYDVRLPNGLGVGLEGIGGYTPETPNCPNGCHICEVTIDPET